MKNGYDFWIEHGRIEYNEAGSQVGVCENPWTPLFEDFGTHMSQSVEKYLDVVGTWLIVR